MACCRHDGKYNIEYEILAADIIFKTNRLFTFQDMCYRSADLNTHKADKWIVKFLLQHSSPIDEKTTCSLEDTSPTVVSRDRGRHANDALSLLK